MVDNKNYFIYKKHFPEIMSILSRKGKSIKEISKKAIFVLDTNSLLAPFSTGKDNIEKIGITYKELISKKRLYIPEHALREFAKNRSGRISDLFTIIDKQLSSLPNLRLPDYPILNDLDAYKKLKKSQIEISEKIKDYKHNLEDLKSNLLDWNWSDPVTTMYQNNFTKDIIISAPGSDEDLIQEFQLRMNDEIPPGNKDKSKSENAIGDFLIWKSMLELGKNKKKDIIFVSNDEKNDWDLKGNQKSISTKFELVDEFYRYTGGFDFIHISFINFLNLEGLDIDIKEVFENEKYQTDTSISYSNDQNLTVQSLYEIARIISDYLSDISMEDESEDVYIQEGISQPIDTFIENYAADYFNTSHWKSYFPYFLFFTNCLDDIRSLNASIHYNSIRQKRSTVADTIKMRALCKDFIRKFAEFDSSVLYLI